jgi:hypothetical protein
VVDKVALGQVFSEYFGFPSQSSFHQLVVAVPSGPIWAPSLTVPIKKDTQQAESSVNLYGVTPHYSSFCAKFYSEVRKYCVMPYDSVDGLDVKNINGRSIFEFILQLNSTLRPRHSSSY